MGEKAARKLRRDTGLPRTASRRSGRACGRGCVRPWAPAVRVAATRVSIRVPPDVDMIAEAEKLRGGTRVLGALLPRCVPVPCAGTATPRRARHNLIPVCGRVQPQPTRSCGPAHSGARRIWSGHTVGTVGVEVARVCFLAYPCPAAESRGARGARSLPARAGRPPPPCLRQPWLRAAELAVTG